MDSQKNRAEILETNNIRELSNSDFMVQAFLSYSQNLYDEFIQITRDTYIKTATSRSQIINLAHNLNYNPRRVETYKAIADISISEKFGESTEYENYIDYTDGAVVRYKGNLFIKTNGSYDPLLGQDWLQDTEVAKEDIVIPIYSSFTAGRLTYYNVDSYIISRGKTYTSTILYEGLLNDQEIGDVGISELVILDGFNIASKTLKVIDTELNTEVSIVEDLSELPPDLNVYYPLTYPKSQVYLANFYPSKNVVANKKAMWLASSREDGFIGSNVLKYPGLHVYHDESYGYVADETDESIKIGASTGLSGRSLTSLQKAENFIRSLYRFSSIIEGTTGGVSYTASDDNKKMLSDVAIEGLKVEVNRNRPIGASIEYKQPFINRIVILANIRLRLGVSKNDLLSSQVIQKFDSKLNFTQSFRVYEFINDLYPLNLVESADIFPCLSFDIPKLTQGDQTYLETNVPMKGVQMKLLIVNSNIILSLDQYGNDLAISYEDGFPGFQVDMVSARFQNQELKVLVEFDLTIPVPDDTTLFSIDHNSSYSLWSFIC